MRLTLRTLLAYLDNTLQPADAEKLRQKLAESGFATNLVRRIRHTLARPDLSAPSPSAVGPVDDANSISEYLDSTLPTEQVAEIERAALESDSKLAETAACHQILTMILGRPAHVSPELRNRIYQLPDRELKEIQDRLPTPTQGGSFSSLNLESDPIAQTKDRDVSSSLLKTGENLVIEPVGKTDSGVTDAPNRLRQSESAPGPFMAGPRAARIDSELTEISRWRRSVPLLVSAAVCAVLMFALTQVFQPLLGRKVADNDTKESASDGIDPSIELIPRPDDSLAEADSNSNAESLPLPPPPTPEDDASASDDIAEVMPAPEVPENQGAESNPSKEMDLSQAKTEVREEPKSLMNDSVPVPEGTPPDQPSKEDPTTPEKDAASADPEMPEATPAASDPETVVAMTPDELAKKDPSVDLAPPVDEEKKPATIETKSVGRLASTPTLLIRLVDQQWRTVTPGTSINSDEFLIAAPTFDSTIVVGDQFEITLIGSAAGKLISEDGLVIVRLDSGRAVLRSKASGVSVPILLGDQLIGLNLDSAETTAAVSVTKRRPPGLDLLDANNRTSQISLLCTAGKIDWAVEEEVKTIEKGHGWTRIDQGPYKPIEIKEPPAWANPASPNGDKSLDASAREGLLSLLSAERPLIQSLREATLFRRTEVVALAARTMLNIGLAEPYFGGDGILNDTRHRIYWPDHFDSLVTAVNRDTELAKAILQDANRMDSAQSATITQLLTGFSQQDLQGGGDQKLVEMLNSPSMTIRVLAIANLKAITGTTLLYRADYDTEARRNAGVKKWIARLKKGDIRWPESRTESPAQKPASDQSTSDKPANVKPDSNKPASDPPADAVLPESGPKTKEQAETQAPPPKDAVPAKSDPSTPQ